MKALAGGSLAAILLAGGVLAAIAVSQGHSHPPIHTHTTPAIVTVVRSVTSPTAGSTSVPAVPPGQVATGTGGTGAGSISTPSRPPPGFTAFISTAFDTYYPSDWSVAYSERRITSYNETKFVSSTGSSFVRVDRSPGQTPDPAAKAGGLEAGEKGAPGYQEIHFRAITLNGQQAFEWTFKVPDSTSPEKVDYFRNVGSDGFAVLGGGTDFASAQRVALVIVGTLRPGQ